MIISLLVIRKKNPFLENVFFIHFHVFFLFYLQLLKKVRQISKITSRMHQPHPICYQISLSENVNVDLKTHIIVKSKHLSLRS